MTAVVFIIALVLAWLHYSTRGFFIADGITIYVAAFASVLASACVAAVVSRNRRSILAALALVANFAGSHYAWSYASDPILFQATLDITTAACFILFGSTRWELTIGGLYLASVLSAVAAKFGVIDDHTTRASVFIALSYPDVAALLGHAASVTLGAGAGDVGRRVRDALQVRPVVVTYRRDALARLSALAKVAGP